MKSRFRLAAILAATLLVTTSSCVVHNVDEAPTAPVAVPEAFNQTAGDGAETVAEADPQRKTPDRWWTIFEDHTLDAMVDQLLSDNLDLRRGWARMAQARAMIRGAESGYWPQIGYDVGLAGNRSNFNVGGPVGVISNTSAQYSMGVSVNWEADLWNKISSGVNAAEFQFAATRQDLEGMALSLTGALTDSYLAAVGERELLEMIDAQEKILKNYVELVELRFGQGMSSALQVYQQQQQLATLQTQRPQVQARLRLYEHQIASLLGKAPGAISITGRSALPDLPAPPEAGLPLDLLGRRPDVRAAQLRVTAADYRVGVAIADRYPAFRISGRVGFQSFDIAELFTSFIWNLAGSLMGPIFDGGRRSAEVERTRAVVEDTLYAYASTVIAALKEVEDALLTEGKLFEEYTLLDRRLKLSESSLTEAEARYVNGLTDYLNVLTAIRAVLTTEQLILLNKRQIYSNRVQLYRALGGSWTAELRPPPSPEEAGESTQSSSDKTTGEESEENAQ